MSATIRKMTKEEFEDFYAWSVEHHAKELMDELHKTLDEAIRETTAEVAKMLPEGLNTQHNYFMAIVEGR